MLSSASNRDTCPETVPRNQPRRRTIDSEEEDGRNRNRHYIRTLVAEMDEEEKKEFGDRLDDMGWVFLKRRAAPTSVSPSLDIYSVVSSTDANEIVYRLQFY